MSYRQTSLHTWAYFPAPTKTTEQQQPTISAAYSAPSFALAIAVAATKRAQAQNAVVALEMPRWELLQSEMVVEWEAARGERMRGLEFASGEAESGNVKGEIES